MNLIHDELYPYYIIDNSAQPDKEVEISQDILEKIKKANEEFFTWQRYLADLYYGR